MSLFRYQFPSLFFCKIMARSRSLSWKTIFVICFVLLCILLLYGNSLFVWRQTTIMITTTNLLNNENNSVNIHIINKSDIQSIHNPSITSYNETIQIEIKQEDNITRLHEHIINYSHLQKHHNLYTNPYDNIPPNNHLNFLEKSDYLLFSECI